MAPRKSDLLIVNYAGKIEKAVRQGLAEGKLKGNEKLPAEATLTLGGIGLSLEIKGEIDLDE